MDKKKKILAIVAVVLMASVAVLGTTGGVKNIKSSFWNATGEDSGFWDYSDENIAIENGGNNNFTPAQILSGKIVQLKEKIREIKVVIAGYETDITALKNKQPELEKNLAETKKTLAPLQDQLKKLISPIDLYVCTKNALYKGKGYVYASAEEYEKRFYEELPATIKNLTSSIEQLKKDLIAAPITAKDRTAELKAELANSTKTANEETAELKAELANSTKTANTKIATLKAELAKIPTKDTAARTTKNKEIAEAQGELKTLTTKINADIKKVATDLATLTKKLNADIKKVPTDLATLTKKLNADIKKSEADKIKFSDERTAMQKSTSCYMTVKSLLAPVKERVSKAEEAVAKAQAALDANNQAITEKNKALTTAKDVTLSDLEEDLEDAEEEFDNNGGNNGSGGDSGNNGSGGDNGPKYKDTRMFCPAGTERDGQPYLITRVDDGEGLNSTHYYVNWGLKNFGEHGNGTSGPFKTAEEADNVALETVCGGIINVSDCYVEIYNAIDARRSNSYKYVCDNSAPSYEAFNCQPRCEKQRDNTQEKINACKSMLDGILRPKQDWDGIERDLKGEFNRCTRECSESLEACTPAVCGDGKIEGTKGELCDDGNTTDGDGCSSTCQITPITIQ